MKRAWIRSGVAFVLAVTLLGCPVPEVLAVWDLRIVLEKDNGDGSPDGDARGSFYEVVFYTDGSFKPPNIIYRDGTWTDRGDGWFTMSSQVFRVGVVGPKSSIDVQLIDGDTLDSATTLEGTETILWPARNHVDTHFVEGVRVYP